MWSISTSDPPWRQGGRTFMGTPEADEVCGADEWVRDRIGDLREPI